MIPKKPKNHTENILICSLALYPLNNLIGIKYRVLSLYVQFSRTDALWTTQASPRKRVSTFGVTAQIENIPETIFGHSYFDMASTWPFFRQQLPSGRGLVTSPKLMPKTFSCRGGIALCSLGSWSSVSFISFCTRISLCLGSQHHMTPGSVLSAPATRLRGKVQWPCHGDSHKHKVGPGRWLFQKHQVNLVVSFVESSRL